LANFIASKLFAPKHAIGIYSERVGGISPAPFDSLNLGFDLGDSEANVQHNIHQLCQTAHIPIPHRSQQVHGTDYLVCSGNGTQHSRHADILITSTPGTAIAVRTADCLPILLLDPHAGIASAVHAGWRGTANNIVHTAIKQMNKLGAETDHILASLGPCISECCFEVDLSTAKQLSQSHAQAPLYIDYKNAKAYPNLQAINALQLQSLGIQEKHIEQIKLCTCCHPKRFFSYRRDQLKSGRQLAIIALAE